MENGGLLPAAERNFRFAPHFSLEPGISGILFFFKSSGETFLESIL